MAEARRATEADVPELVRLRTVMFASLDTAESPPDGAWAEAAARAFRDRIGADDPTLAAFVVDAGDSVDVVDAGDPPRLAACAVGSIERRIASPRNPLGTTGWVFNVVTDPDHRRRGYSRACMVALLEWYRTRGVDRVELRASASGEPLYRALGFERTDDPAMRLRLADRPTATGR